MRSFDPKALGMLIVVVIALSALISYPMMLLWNYCLVPAVSTLAEVGWMQMWGIVLLLKAIFQSSVSVNAK